MITRRRFLQTVSTGAAAALAPGAAARSAPRSVARRSRERFNVLSICFDDLNDWIEPLRGHPQVKTPNFNRLAERCVTFNHAYCAAPICNPARAALLTGVMPASSSLYYLKPLIRECEATRRAVTLPQQFARHGYHSVGVGKIFHQRDDLEFEEYAGTFGAFGPVPEQPVTCGLTHRLWDWGNWPGLTDEMMPDYQIAEWAGARLQQRFDRPFFLAVGFRRPHVPMYAPPRWFDLYPLEQVELPPHRESELADVPPYGQDLSWSFVAPRHEWIVRHGEWRHAVQSYLACVSFVDAQLGRLLDALDRSPHAANTLIVLWSDHGFHLGTKQRWGKRSLWEPATHIPLMFAVPGMRGGRVCERTVGQLDIYPTLMDLCGLPQPMDLQGRSLVPLLEDPQQAWPWPALTSFGQNNHAVRSENWRYIVYADGSEELYDHRRDPHEFTNLAREPQHREIIERHREWLPQINQPMVAGSADCDARPGSPADIDHRPPGAVPRPDLPPERRKRA